MVNARLHIICGNCGCNDMFEFEAIKDFHDYTDEVERFEYGYVLTCKNCHTNHDIEDNTIKKD